LQIVLPKNYLKEVYEEMREEGALCVADEVQCGFGRHGDHFWAFAEQDVVPDVVTLGKPIGNGFPMGAVVSHQQQLLLLSVINSAGGRLKQGAYTVVIRKDAREQMGISSGG